MYHISNKSQSAKVQQTNKRGYIQVRHHISIIKINIRIITYPVCSTTSAKTQVYHPFSFLRPHNSHLPHPSTLNFHTDTVT